MNIGFDAKRYFHNHTGLGNYSRDLVDILCSRFPENHYFLFDKDPSTLDLPANTIAVVPMGNKLLWREYGMLQDVKRFQLDVFHGLSNELPWGKWPSNTRKIVTVHDVIFNLFPEHYAGIDRFIYQQKTGHAIKIADVIIATSHATAKDLVQHYHADEKKLRVIYQTCGAAHWKIYTEREIADFKNRRQLHQAFMLYVSSFETRKNHVGLLKAIKLMGDKNARLVLAGRQKETFKDCLKFVRENGLEKQVVFITDISNAELPLLYRSAQSFVYPSMVEGFGIPLVEAACAGLPIAVNDIGVFREIAPDTAMFFVVKNTENLAGTMKELMLRTREDYTTHLKIFNPGFAADKMMEIYKSNI